MTFIITILPGKNAGWRIAVDPGPASLTIKQTTAQQSAPYLPAHHLIGAMSSSYSLLCALIWHFCVKLCGGIRRPVAAPVGAPVDESPAGTENPLQAGWGRHAQLH
jgi:hypothetical protein